MQFIDVFQPTVTLPAVGRSNAIAEVNGSFGDTLSPNLSPRPANSSQFQPTPANPPAAVRFGDSKELRRKTKKPRTEGSVLANRRLQALGRRHSKPLTSAASYLSVRAFGLSIDCPVSCNPGASCCIVPANVFGDALQRDAAV